MKTFIKLILQRVLGFERYLFLFSLFIIKKLKWDRNERDFLHFLELLPEKGVVLDIGANLGVMSYYLASDSDRRLVYAFEPVACNFENLLKIRNRYALSNLKCYQLALGEEDGEIEMVLPVQRSVKFHGLAHVKHESIQEMNEGEFITCPVKRLDNFEPLLAEQGRLTGIKIDVENYEYHVLKGADKLLRQHSPVIYCELWENENRTKTMELLRKLNYRAMVLESKRLVPYRPGVHTTQNFFFIPVVSK